MKEIKKKHPLIYKRIKKCRTNNADTLIQAFIWEETKEGYSVWKDVNKGKYKSFYDFHNLSVKGKRKKKKK